MQFVAPSRFSPLISAQFTILLLRHCLFYICMHFRALNPFTCVMQYYLPFNGFSVLKFNVITCGFTQYSTWYSDNRITVVRIAIANNY